MVNHAPNRRYLVIGLVLCGLAIAVWKFAGSRSRVVSSPDAPVADATTASDRARHPYIQDVGAAAIADAQTDAMPVLISKSGAMVTDRTTHGMRDVPDPTPPGTEFQLKGVSAATGTALGNAMLPVVAACAQQVPSEARGSHPMVQPAFTVQVAAGELTVTDVAFSTRDIAAGARDTFTACMREGAIGAKVPAAGEGDLDRYLIHIPMRLPK